MKKDLTFTPTQEEIEKRRQRIKLYKEATVLSEQETTKEKEERMLVYPFNKFSFGENPRNRKRDEEKSPFFFQQEPTKNLPNEKKKKDVEEKITEAKQSPRSSFN